MVGNGSSLELDLDVEVLSIANGGRPLGQDLLGVGPREGGQSETVLYPIVSGDGESKTLSDVGMGPYESYLGIL